MNRTPSYGTNPPEDSMNPVTLREKSTDNIAHYQRCLSTCEMLQFIFGFKYCCTAILNHPSLPLPALKPFVRDVLTPYSTLEARVCRCLFLAPKRATFLTGSPSTFSIKREAFLLIQAALFLPVIYQQRPLPPATTINRIIAGNTGNLRCRATLRRNSRQRE